MPAGSTPGVPKSASREEREVLAGQSADDSLTETVPRPRTASSAMSGLRTARSSVKTPTGPTPSMPAGQSHRGEQSRAAPEHIAETLTGEARDTKRFKMAATSSLLRPPGRTPASSARVIALPEVSPQPIATR